ncbi:WYL domain-containing protein [Pedobacter changchengzhani]|uniref:WYL domain-containing protein n=1 Tax=Pedobacter changchengzhani TaxID=2529274 RepID=A0A4R5MN07_9SPHI|nr:WYL domain-containing protein [Pedobacter changchengzhani]TDG37112.1 WYL domain-containing protein [Pedobacter changchengzhani]
MPANLDALLRYHTIDLCLQNRFKKWTCEDLANACADYADEVAPRDSRSIPSKRTIQQDIKVMRSADLGYFAPIKNESGCYYYEDEKYSIKNVTLSKLDVENISLASKILGQYKGFDFFKDLHGIFERFESRLQIQIADKLQSNIAFENSQAINGQEFLKPLLNAINEKLVVQITYQKFGDISSKIHQLHPYLLKEYQDFWYVLGWHPASNAIKTFAVDRIENIEIKTDKNFIENLNFHNDTYFKDTIGITFTGDNPEKIVLHVDNEFAPYLIAKPLHQSQQLVETKEKHTIFKYLIVVNQELENILMSHANHISILTPINLRESLKQKLVKALNNFS